MEEKERKFEERNDHTKLTWETPKLYNLNKKETMGGNNQAYTESYGNNHAMSGS